MALTFPRDMPVRPPEQVYFELDRADFLSRERSGRLYSVQMGFPLWRLDMDLTGSTAEVFDEVRAWVSSLEGAARTFYGRDPSRPYPKAHPDGFARMRRPDTTAFDGSASSWSVDATRTLLNLAGLPKNLRLSVGDYVGFAWTTESEERRALVRCLEARIADSSGEIEAMPVTPAVPGGDFTIVPAEATAYLNEPCCIMRLDPRQTTIGKMDALMRGDVRVVALQDLRP